MGNKTWFNRENAALYLDVSTSFIDKKLKKGEFPKPSTKLGVKSLRWHKYQLDELMKGNIISYENIPNQTTN